MCVKLELGEVEVTQGCVIVLERGRVLGETLIGREGQVLRWKKPEEQVRRGEQTSSWDFNCDSCLKREILTSRRDAGSELDIKENPSLLSRYRSNSLRSGAGSMT